MICAEHLAGLWNGWREADLTKVPAAVTVRNGTALCLECFMGYHPIAPEPEWRDPTND